MFLGARREIFRVFPSKNYALVFCLIVLKTSILDLLAVNTFVSWVLFLFGVEFKFKANSFCVNMGLYLLQISSESVFVLLKFNEREIYSFKRA